jgi:hypothetical protein
MAMISAHEWYREYHQAKSARLTRDHEGDAPEAEAQDEKIFE